MIEPLDEFIRLAAALDERGLDYAVCGGIALAMYGYVRATEDIDLLVEADSLPAIRGVTALLGFRFTGPEIEFKSGIKIVRLLKSYPDHEEVLILDLVLVNDRNRAVWDARQTVTVGTTTVRIVSRDGLKQMKRESGRAIDLEDIKRIDQKPYERGHES